MSDKEVESIKEFFSNLEINPFYLEHESVITSEDAARTRGFELKEGIKAILFTNEEDKWVIVNIPADKKVDQKKVADRIGWSKSKIRMATSEEVLEKTGCQIGAVPPFGHKEVLQILVDAGVYDNEKNAFNIGLRTHSVKINTDDVRKIFEELKVIEGIFSK